MRKYSWMLIFLVFLFIFIALRLLYTRAYPLTKNKAKYSIMEEYCLVQKGSLSVDNGVSFCTFHGKKQELASFYFEMMKKGNLEKRIVQLKKDK